VRLTPWQVPMLPLVKQKRIVTKVIELLAIQVGVAARTECFLGLMDEEVEVFEQWMSVSAKQ